MDYNQNAKAIAGKLNLKVAIQTSVIQTPPDWGKDSPHGIKYYVTIRKGDTTSKIRFPFWDSLHNEQQGKKPSVYDVLACVASDLSMPQTADEVYSEFGEMKPSQCGTIAAWARKLNEFFTEAEREALSEIQ